ncbi:hypothetical protein D3C71_1225450 [compost metagenome]
MLAGDQVAAPVVLEALGVIAPLVGVQRRGQQCRQGRAMTRLADLPALGFDQLIQAVVAVAVDRVDALVVEMGHGLGQVVQFDDVAHRVVDVVQVLQGLLVSDCRYQPDQPAVIGSVFDVGQHPIAGGFAFDLILGVVANVVDQGLRRLSYSGQLQPDLTRFSCHVVAKGSDVAHGIGLFLKLTGGIEAVAGDE